jgi:hypothetical protein
MRKKKKIAVKRKPTLPKKMSSLELCAALSGIAAFHVKDEATRMSIYEAIRRLQLLDALAIDAGILPR